MTALQIERESAEAPNVCRDFSGQRLVLEPYRHGCAPRNLGTQSGYSLWIKSIFPYKYPRGTANRASRDQFACGAPSEYVIEERYSLVIRGSGGEAWQGRYTVKDSPPSQETGKARRRMRRMRLADRLNAMLDLWVLSALAAFWAWFFGPVAGINLLPVGLLVLLFAFFTARPRGKRPDVVMKLAGLRWSLNDFCRGWLVTGATGSGKTQGLTLMLHSICKHQPNWGGLGCDEKGLWHEVLTGIARTHGREKDLILLQTRPKDASRDWIPPGRFNLLSDPETPSELYATLIVETATSVAGGKDDKGFFRTQAHAHIRWGITLMRVAEHKPSLHQLLELLTQKEVLVGVLNYIEPKRKAGNLLACECYNHFRANYLAQAPEQLSGVISTIYNYLNYFANSEIAEVFGDGDNSFEFADLSDGAIVCISMPQKYKTERLYISTILKQLAYTHALRRFDPRRPGERPLDEDNLLIIWQDEAQRFVTEDDGNIDVLRQARMTTVMATQTQIAFVPKVGQDRWEVMGANLCNRLIYTGADLKCAEMNAIRLGKDKTWKKSYSCGRGGITTSRHKEPQYLIEPYEIIKMKKFRCIVRHAEGKLRKAIMHPRGVDGKRPSWYPFWKELLWIA
jgi:hypothetical protein